MTKQRGNALLYLIALFLSTITLLPLWPATGSDYSIYNIQRLSEIILVCCAALLLIFSTARRQAWIKTFSTLPEIGRLLVILVLGLGVVSTLSSTLPRYAFLELGLFALLLFLCISIAAETQNASALRTHTLISFIAISVAIYGILFYLNLILTFSNNTLSPGFSNIRFLAQYQAWTLPLITLPLFLIRSTQKWYRIAIHATAAAWWSIAFFNSAKGLGISLLISGVLIALLFRGAQTKKWFITQASPIALGLVTYIAVSGLTLKTGHLTQIDSSIGSRIALWMQALEIAFENPWLGIGPLHFARHYNGFAAHPHNSLLQIAAEWGLPAAIMLLGLFLWGGVAWIRERNGKHTPTDIALSFSLLTAAIYSLVSGVIVTPVSQVLLAIIVGLIIGNHQTSRKAVHPTVSRQSSGLLIAALILIFIRFGVVLFPEVLYLARDEFVWIATHSVNGHASLQPRFWQQGWLIRP